MNGINRNSIKCWSIFIVLLALCPISPIPGQSFEPNIKLGDVEVHPRFSIRTKYTSNLFSEDKSGSEDPDEDYILILRPGIGLKYPGVNMIIDANYYADIERYDQFDNEETEKQSGDLDIHLISPGNDVEFTLRQRYLDTRDPASDDAQSNADLVQAEREDYAIGGKLKIELGELARMEFNVDRKDSEYDNRSLDVQNSETDSFGGAFFYKFHPLTSWTINYNFQKTTYPDATASERSDSDTNTLRFGISMDPTAKLSGDITVGFTDKELDGGNRKDKSTLAIQTKLDWDARERTKLTLKVSRTLEDSTFGDASQLTRTHIGLGMDQGIGDSITAIIDGGFSHSDYPSGRTDKKYRFGIHLRYAIKEWIFVGGGYDFQSNLSNENDREYRTHETVFNIGLAF